MPDTPSNQRAYPRSHEQKPGLGFPIARIGALIGLASGAKHAPVSREGDPPGGHHRKRVVRFAPVSPRPEAIELRLQRPGEPIPRSFRWELK